MIELTPIEFSEFNLKSKLKLLHKDGELLNYKVVNERYNIQLYSVYGFYVQCVSDNMTSQTTDVEIVVSNNWLGFHDSS